MKRITVNGVDLDLYPNDKINLNINLNDISDISTRNSTYSNTIKIPKTSKNIKTFGYLGTIGNTSNSPYEKIKCNYFINDLPVINDGYLTISKTTEDEFYIVLFDGVLDLQERIKGKYISDLELLNTLNHNRNITSVVNSLDYTEGYIYAFQYNQKDNIGLFGSVTVDRMIPTLFVKSILEAILFEAGYIYSGEIFNNSEFADEVFTMAEGVTDNTINFAEIVPKIKQDTFLKDVLIRYAQVIRLNGNNIEFQSMNKIINGDFGSLDLTDKLIKIKDEKYNIDYAQNNLFTWSYSNDLNDDGDGYLYVENETLENEKTSYTSPFDFNTPNYIYKILSVVDFLHIPTVPLIEIEVDEDTNEEEFKALKFNSGLFKLNRLNTDFQIREDSSSTYQTIVGKDVILSTDNVNWNHYLNENYTRTQHVLNNYKTISVTLGLNDIDVYNLDFFKIVFLQQTGQYYYLNNIKYDGTTTTASLTQINGAIENNNVIIQPDNATITITDANLIYPNPPLSFDGAIFTTYQVEDYFPTNLIIRYTQLDNENGVPTGLNFTDSLDVNNNTHNQPLPIYINENVCGWYSIQISDPDNNIQSNEYQVYYECEENTVDTTPSIDILSYFYEQNSSSSSFADVGYRFNNFTPTTATMKIQKWNYINQAPEGTVYTYNLIDLTPDTEIRLEDLSVPSGANSLFKRVTVTTDTISKTVNTLL